jgi:hypothetical protein
MKDPVEWNEADVLSLIDNEVQESLTLDYKQSDALGKSGGKKSELSKDVSAFANSSGGTILYGMAENGHYPTLIDCGLDSSDISKEWIEQVLNSSVHPKIDGLRINQIPLSSTGTGRVLYAICIPAATSRAPHQAKDKRYYKRYNFESVPMEDYEIRDLYRRASTPDLWIEFSFDTGKAKNLVFQSDLPQSDAIALQAVIGNRSREPALYTVVRVFLDAQFIVLSDAGCSPSGTAEYDGRRLNVYLKKLGIPGSFPIFSEADFSLWEPPLTFALDEKAIGWPEFYIGYEVRTPGFSDGKMIRVINQPRGTLWIPNEGHGREAVGQGPNTDRPQSNPTS